MSTTRIRCALSIAGSDSGGGAGIQADLKAFAACGVHGTTAITAVTAQNTTGVGAIHHIPPDVIIAQVRAVHGDIGVDAVKIGMLGTTATIDAVATALDALASDTPVVLDPVMVSESGAQLLEPAARAALVDRLLPRATVVTPNIPEALALVAPAQVEGERAGHAPAVEGSSNLDIAALARAVRELGPAVVVVTGGHREQAIDLFFDGGDPVEIAGERHPDGAAHGSGCTHSSVLAARLALGDEPLAAARIAKAMASRAVAVGLVEVGHGPGPVNVLGLGS